LSNVAELATESIVLLLFEKSEWMDTGAADVQSVLAVKLYRRDIVMKMRDDSANEVCVRNRKSCRIWMGVRRREGER